MYRLLAAVLVVGLAGCQSAENNKVNLETAKDKISYSIGLSVGKSLGKDSLEINYETFLRGVKDASADSAHRLLTDAEIQQVMMAFQDSINAKRSARTRAAAEKSTKEGEAFLAENAKKPGVITLPSGVQYRVLTEGKGKRPAETSTVTTNYAGRLIDGTEFDSSYKRGQPATFPCNGVNKGWTEALLLMREGSKWEIYIPASLAYGENGAGNVIPPNATLIFEIELISVQ
jgi:FKBP-type peptidyl-prolyl cis-trans isomerase FklB